MGLDITRDFLFFDLLLVLFKEQKHIICDRVIINTPAYRKEKNKCPKVAEPFKFKDLEFSVKSVDFVAVKYQFAILDAEANSTSFAKCGFLPSTSYISTQSCTEFGNECRQKSTDNSPTVF